MLQLVGETRGEYFHINCDSCGSAVRLNNLRMPGGVPRVEATCEDCGESFDFKLHPPTWLDLLENGASLP